MIFKMMSLALLAGLVACGPANKVAHGPCDQALEADLKSCGIDSSSLRERDWVPEMRPTSPNREEVSGYQFYAEPAACPRGQLVARLDVECRITQVYTRGGCNISTERLN
jgi:hypothetical protein